ncbi:glutathione S-transferase family protein [Zooshikella ganghwensis]|nr:glutathione S-transferase family protein [Zooshikella ganghwensis]
MLLYGVPLSPFVRKVILSLKLLKINYELKPVIPFDLPKDFDRLNPLRKVPVLVDGDLTIPDSTIICLYLNDQYGQAHQLYPVEPKLKAQAMWLEEYADSRVMEVLGPPLFLERVVKQKFKKQPADEQRIAKAINQDIPPVLDYLESQVPTSDFLFDTFGIVEISIGSQFLNARYANYEVDPMRWPILAAYLERIWQEPLFKECMLVDEKLLSS